MSVVLEALVPGHAEEMFGGLRDERAYAFIPDEPPVDVAALRARYEHLATGGAGDGSELWFNWVIRDGEGRACGYVQATCREEEAIVGYHVFPAFWGQGVGTGAVRLMLERVFVRPEVMVARGTVDPRNVVSIALLRKVGFRLERRDEDGNFVFDLSRVRWEAGAVIGPRVKMQPTVKERAQAELEARRAREGAALRANLRRRKAQVRGRE